MTVFLRSCPYCKKNTAKLMKNEKQCGHNGLDDPVFRYKAYVRCMNCHARGPLASGMVMHGVKYELPDWADDPWEINQAAIDNWNGDLKNLNHGMEKA